MTSSQENLWFTAETAVQRRVKEDSLQSGLKSAVRPSDDLRTGYPVPEHGFYRILHPQHVLPKEITLLLGQSFPRCSKCSEPVYFELIRPAPLLGMNTSGFSKITVYELPEVGEAERSEESLAS